MEKWYDLTPEQIANKLGSNLQTGLDKAEAVVRLRIQGPNQIYEVPKGQVKTYLKHIFTDLSSLLLVISAIIASVFRQNISATVIIFLILINTAVAVLTYIKSHRVIEDIGVYSQPSAKVMRNGRMCIIKCEQLVPGDIIFVSVGDIVPADARLIKSEKLTVLEAQLTGVKSSVRKDAKFTDVRILPPEEQRCMIFSSTVITGGSGRAIVCETTDDTLVARLGKGKKIVTHENLKILKRLNKYCSAVSLAMIVTVFVVVLCDIFLGHNESSLFDSFITAMTLSVASMSEFYVAFGYITVACGIFRAINRSRDINSGILIKSPEKLEELKSIDTLIIPKSSLIASDSIHIERVYANGFDLSVGASGFRRNSANVIKYAVVSTGKYGGQKLINDNMSGNYSYTKEEELIIGLAKSNGYYNVNLDRDFPIVQHVCAGRDSRFDTTLCFCEGKFVIVLRGEALAVINRCYHIREGNRVVPMTERRIEEFRMQIPRIRRENFNMIAVATRTSPYTNLQRIGACQDDLILEGIIAIKEPLLEGAAKNIARCPADGIRIIMTTDTVDNNDIEIAKSLGIIANESEAITGREIADMHHGIFRANTPLYNLYRGLSIAQTRELIANLRADGRKVGTLSRTLAEISYISESDIGFTEGITLSKNLASGGIDGSSHIPASYSGTDPRMISGCEALKYASDVIISEPCGSGCGGFNSMLGAIKTSKVVYLNLLRMFRYLLITQSARIFTVLFSVLSGIYLLTPVQILFSGLIIDLVAVFTIAFQSPSIVTPKVEDTEKSLERFFRRNSFCIVIGLLWSVFSFALYFIFVRAKFTYEVTSIGFISFIVAQIMTLLEVKNERSLFFPSVRFNGMSLLTLVTSGIIIFLSYLYSSFGSVFGITEMSGYCWNLVIAQGIFTFVMFEVLKLILYGKTVKVNWNFGTIIDKLGDVKDLIGKKDSQSNKPSKDDSKTTDNSSDTVRSQNKPANITELFENFDLEEFIVGHKDNSGTGITSDSTGNATLTEATDVSKKRSKAASGIADEVRKSAKTESEAEFSDVSATGTSKFKDENYAIGNSVIDNIFSTKKENEK